VRLALAVALMFFARFVASAFSYWQRDGDIAWQRWLGGRILATHALPSALGRETFTAATSRWIPQEWLLSLSVALAMRSGHFWILATLFALLGAGTIALVALRARLLGGSTLAVLPICLCTGMAMTQAFGVRAQVVGWFCLALFVLLLEYDESWSIGAIAVAVLWANAHASVMLAPVVSAIWTIGAFCDTRRFDTRVRRGLIVTLASAAATCATPLGYHLPLYAIELMRSPIRHAIAEWQPSSIHSIAFAAGIVPLALTAAILGMRGMRLHWRVLLPFGTGLLLSFTAIRNVPIAAILMAPPVAGLLGTVLPDRGRLVAMLREPLVATVVVAATLAGTLAVASRVRAELSASHDLPFRAIAVAASLPGTRRLYCQDFAWCSLALAYRNLRTFVDGRCDAFPLSVWRDYLAIDRAKPGWPAALLRYRVNTVLAARNRPLARELATSSDWTIVSNGERYVLFARERS
jgi:hypothetical protein